MTQTPPADLYSISDFLDNKYKGPFGFRFGWDALLGLIPGVGDVVTSGLSLYLIFRAAMLNCPPIVLLRMGLNLLVENILDVIPVIGNLFDFAWKANAKNMVLLEAHLQNPTRTLRRSRWVVWSTFLLITAVIVSIVTVTIYFLWQLFFETAW